MALRLPPPLASYAIHLSNAGVRYLPTLTAPLSNYMMRYTNAE